MIEGRGNNPMKNLETMVEIHMIVFLKFGKSLAVYIGIEKHF